METIIKNRQPIVSASFIILLSTMILLLMVYGRSIIVPVVIAFVVWFIINEITDSIQRVGLAGRGLSRPIAMGVTLLLIVYFMVTMGRIVYYTSFDIIQQAESYRVNLDALLKQVPQFVWDLIPSATGEQITADLDQLFVLVTDNLSAYISTLAANIVNIIVQAALVLVYVIFLLLEQNTFATKVANMFPNEARRAEAEQVLGSIKQQIQKYVSIKTLVSLLTGLGSFLVMRIIGLDYALVWAIIVFLLNYIPYVGSIIAVIFPVGMSLLQFGNWTTVFILFALLFVIQTAVGYFIEPWLMGNSLDISPFIVLFSIAVFGTIWGIIGMFLSVPLVIILMVIFSHFEATRGIAVMLSGDGVLDEFNFPNDAQQRPDQPPSDDEQLEPPPLPN